jgi:hypothetical protein
MSYSVSGIALHRRSDGHPDEQGEWCLAWGLYSVRPSDLGMTDELVRQDSGLVGGRPGMPSLYGDSVIATSLSPTRLQTKRRSQSA